MKRTVFFIRGNKEQAAGTRSCSSLETNGEDTEGAQDDDEWVQQAVAVRKHELLSGIETVHSLPKARSSRLYF
jgi:hypothetical protein